MQQSMNVLVVEDNGTQAELVACILREEGWAKRVIIACDGEAAFNFLFCPDENPSIYPFDMILLDLDIPDIDGLDVLKRIKNDPRTQAIPVIVLTASYLENDMNKSYRLGANSFLRKPVDLAQLTQVLQYWTGDGLEACSGG